MSTYDFKSHKPRPIPLPKMESPEEVRPLGFVRRNKSNKTTWAGILAAGAGAGLIALGNPDVGGPLLTMGILAILGRDAVSKIENGQKKGWSFDQIKKEKDKS